MSRENGDGANQEMPMTKLDVGDKQPLLDRSNPPPTLGAVASNVIPPNCYVFEGVPLLRSVETIPVSAMCDLCHQGAERGDLFRPCRCYDGQRYFHRTCFRSWRTGWINPRNYFCCPDCMTSYRIERVKQSSIRSESQERIVRHFRIRMFIFYFGMLCLLFALIGGIAGIAYGADNNDKNVPVGVKYMLTSVVSGFPSSNSTQLWREQFKQPDTAVWPYYTLLGSLCAAILILITFAMVGCTFDEDERQRRSCSDQCGCGGTGSTNTYAFTYWSCYSCNTPCDACYCPCDQCCDRCCGNGSSGGGCGGGNCGGGDCDMKGGGEALLIILLVVIVIVLLSAIVVIILYTIKKWTLFHDRMTDMIQCQAQELESETIVLGIDETLRPTDAV